MKKVIAVLFSLLLSLSMASCGRGKSNLVNIYDPLGHLSVSEHFTGEILVDTMLFSFVKRYPSSNSNSTIEFSYSSDGYLTHAIMRSTKNIGSYYEISYDPEGYPIKWVYGSEGEERAYEICEWTYDANHNLLIELYYNDRIVPSTGERFYHLSHGIAYTYDASSNITGEIYYNGAMITTYSFDPVGEQTCIDEQEGTSDDFLLLIEYVENGTGLEEALTSLEVDLSIYDEHGEWSSDHMWLHKKESGYDHNEGRKVWVSKTLTLSSLTNTLYTTMPIFQRRPVLIIQMT